MSQGAPAKWPGILAIWGIGGIRARYALYILPNFQNPGGTTLSDGHRYQLVLLADKCGSVIEHDPDGQLRYEGEHLPTLLVLGRENLRRDNGYSMGNGIYLSTFSTAPGLRLECNSSREPTCIPSPSTRSWLTK